MTLGERIFGWLLRAYPREFRERYAGELLLFFRAERAHPRYGRGPLRPIRFWIATVRDLARAAAAERGGLPMRPLAALRFDLRNAVRSLAGTPAVTLTALAVLALGIGASTAIFSLVDGIVLREVPYPDGARLLAVSEMDLASGRPLPAAYQEYADWAQQQDVFAGIGASATAPVWTTRDAERPQRLRPHRVSATLFDVLGVHPAIGRGFTAEAVARTPRLALISDALWRTRFAADPLAVGRTIAFDTGTYEIAGVMPRGFAYPIGTALASNIDLWVPYVPQPVDLVRGNTRNLQMRVVARLAPGVTVAQAAGRMKALNDRLAAQSPAWFAGRGILVRTLKDSIVPAPVRSWMLMLLVAVGGVLLVACANIANLLLARVAGRGREMGVRLARAITAVAAGLAIGFVAAAWLERGIMAFVYSGRAHDPMVYGAAALLVLAIGCVAAYVPARRASRVDPLVAIRAE